MALAAAGCGGAAEWDEGAGAGGSAGESASERGSEPATGGYRLVPPDEYPVAPEEPEPAHPEPEVDPPEVEPELPTLGSPCDDHVDCVGVTDYAFCYEGRCGFYCDVLRRAGGSFEPDRVLMGLCNDLGPGCQFDQLPAQHRLTCHAE